MVVLMRNTENGKGFAAGFSGFGFGATGGTASEIFQSRLGAALTRNGYDILEPGDIERLAGDDELEKPTEKILLRLSREAGADAILIGITEAGSQMKFGFFGLGSGVEKGIVSASIKLVDAESARTMAIISADYEEPKNANEVIDALAPFLSKTMQGEAEEVRELKKGLL